jgi:putative SOS response-associated peptidase YedK
MPVIIERENWPLRLGEVEGDPSILLRPAPENILRTWPVDKRVGNVKNDWPELIEPVAASPSQSGGKPDHGALRSG